MKQLLSKRDARALVRGLLVIGAIVGIAKGVPAWRRWESMVRRDAGSALHSVALVEAGVRQLGAMRDSVTDRRRRLDSLAAILFEAGTVPEATAALAVHISESATASEVKVSTIQLRADSAFASDGFARIAVRLTATSDIAGLSDLLDAIEGDRLLLAIRELNVTQPEPAMPDTKFESLQIELLIEGLAMHPRVRGR